MAKHGSPSVGFLLVNGVNLLPFDVLSVDGPDKESVIERTDGLGKTWEESKATGTYRATFGFEQYYDDTLASFAGQEQTAQVVCLSWTGNAVGAKFTGMAGAFAMKAPRSVKRGALHKQKVTCEVTGQVEEGLVLQELETKTVDWNTEGADSVDHGASTSGGGAGYLQIETYAGLTNIIVKIRHSADDVTYADLITFATATAVGAQRVAVAGTVNRHLAVDGNVSGAGSVSILCGFCRAAA